MRALIPLLLLLPANALAAGPSGRKEFEEAKRLFDGGQPERALPLFEKAVELSRRRPSTLLALALCERELGRNDAALAHLDEYLEATPSDRAKYAELRAELAAKLPPPSPVEPEERAAPAEPPPIEPPPKIEPPPPPAVATPPPPIEASEGPSVLKLTLLSAGGAAVVTGVVFAVLAARAESAVEHRDPATREDAIDRAEQGFRFAVTADVLVISGAVAAGVGLFLD